MESKDLGLLRQVCLPRREKEEEENCGQGFGEDESLLPPLRTKGKSLVPLQWTEVEGLTQNLILPNGLADPLGIELLEL